MNRSRIVVIADDITGAAELAGIGYRYGLNTILTTNIKCPIPDCELLVIATDTRSMDKKEAVQETQSITQYLKQTTITHLFKKTDSALRGHITAELHTLLGNTDYKEVLLLPQNPTKGRYIQKGIYYINDIPLHKTAFAYDPEFPMQTSHVNEIIQSFSVKDANNYEQVKKYVSQTSKHTLLAGAADLFTAYLEHLGYTPKDIPSFKGLSASKILIICGSTQSVSLTESAYVSNHQVHSSTLPPETFYNGNIDIRWIQEIKKEYSQNDGFILTTNGYLPQKGKEFAIQLRQTMAKIIKELVTDQLPYEFIIEGGATAFAILKELGWSNFELSDEIVPGVIRMKCNSFTHTHIILKPGSYSWGNLFE